MESYTINNSVFFSFFFQYSVYSRHARGPVTPDKIVSARRTGRTNSDDLCSGYNRSHNIHPIFDRYIVGLESAARRDVK